MNEPVGLVQRAIDGDQLAFAELIERHATRLLLFLERRGAGLIGPDFGIEDAFQNVVLRAWQALPQIEARGGPAFYVWLVEIGRNVLGNRVHYRRGKGRDVAQRDAAGLPTERRLGNEVIASLTSVPTRAARAEQMRRLNTAITELAPEHRELVERVYVRGAPLRETAAQLDIPISTAWNRLQSALAQLRDAASDGPHPSRD